MAMRNTKYIYFIMGIIGTVILLAWLYFNFGNIKNNVVLAAMIQVIGLVIIGFLAKLDVLFSSGTKQK